MTLHNIAKEEESKTELQTMTNSGLDVEQKEAHSHRDDEEERKRWLSTRYKRESTKPIEVPLTASWDLPISDADVEKLKMGFKSRSQDDKWDLVIKDPDDNGYITLHILRTSSQKEYYTLHIIPRTHNSDDRTAKIQSITWEGNKKAWSQAAEDEAKRITVILSRYRLNCKFETFPY